MKKFFWKLKSNGFRLISAFISRDGKIIDRIFASVEKNGKRYSYDGTNLVENSGIEGIPTNPDEFDIDEIEDKLPKEGRHIILLSQDIKVLIPQGIAGVRVIEMNKRGRVIREYETSIGGTNGL